MFFDILVDAKFSQMELLHVMYPLVNVYIDVENPPFVDRFPKLTIGFPHLCWVITSWVPPYSFQLFCIGYCSRWGMRNRPSTWFVVTWSGDQQHR